MNTPVEKKIIIIAGPNGAGKTTFAKEFLPNEAACPVFINADLIAAGLAPFQPESAAFKAGRIMLEAIHHHVHKRQSFAFETTLSGRTYAGFIPDWQRLGYKVKLLFCNWILPSWPSVDDSRPDLITWKSCTNRWLMNGRFMIIRV